MFYCVDGNLFSLFLKKFPFVSYCSAVLHCSVIHSIMFVFILRIWLNLFAQ